MCPCLSGRRPLSHRVHPCFLCSLRAESVSHSFLHHHSPALFLAHGKTLHWHWAKVTHLQNESRFTGRAVWYRTEFCLTSLSGSRRYTLICSRGHELDHTCCMCSKSLLDNVPLWHADRWLRHTPKNIWSEGFKQWWVNHSVFQNLRTQGHSRPFENILS